MFQKETKKENEVSKMNIKYEQIKAANDTIQTMTISRKDKKTGQIKNKEYAEVNQRIKAFRMVFPDGFIITEMVSNEGGVCVFAARVGYYGEDKEPYITGTGTAYEREDSSYINETSYIENCETSAVGRALGMAGFGVDLSVASAEEVQNAIANQEAAEKPKETKATAKQIEMIKELVTDIPTMLNYYKVEKIEDLTVQQASAIIKKKKGAK